MSEATTTSWELFQESHDERFSCCICLGPKLQMVSGRCQHRICGDCVYDKVLRRPCMEKCPICGLIDSFPRTRPSVPAEVVSIQRMIGVTECPNGCQYQMWYWDVEEHLKWCEKSSVAKPEQTKRSQHQSESHQRRSPNSSPVSMRTTRSVNRQQKSLRHSRWIRRNLGKRTGH